MKSRVLFCFFCCAALLSAAAAEPVRGWATWYSRESCQREGTGGEKVLMANGQPLDDGAMTCALWITGRHGRPLRPDGRLVSVRNIATGQAIEVSWTDNGPGKRARARGVIIDLTPAAMRALAGEGGIGAGRIPVRIQEDADDERERTTTSR